MINNHKSLCLGVLMCGGLLLAGCQNTSKTQSQGNPSASSTVEAPPQQISVEPAPTREEPKNSKIGLCQSELASLKQINPKAYAVKQAYFNRLLNNASVYSAVRGDVNTATKDTLDALYKFKTNQLCADIEREVLQGLIRRGESVK